MLCSCQVAAAAREETAVNAPLMTPNDMLENKDCFHIPKFMITFHIGDVTWLCVSGCVCAISMRGSALRQRPTLSVELRAFLNPFDFTSPELLLFEIGGQRFSIRFNANRITTHRILQ